LANFTLTNLHFGVIIKTIIRASVRNPRQRVAVRIVIVTTNFTPQSDRQQNESPKPMRQFPAKLYVETTTQCNLACPMCVKQTWGSDAVEGFLDPGIFEQVKPAFPHLDALILNGIGEPLLHPLLEKFISAAKETMQRGSWVGFQSNGLLIDRDRARSLVAAGLDKICISVDAINPELYRSVRSGGELGSIEQAFSDLLSAKKSASDSSLQVGIEFVVMSDNLLELPGAVRWAAQHGATFAIVTHLLPYHEAMVAHTCFDANTDSALELYRSWKEKAVREGIDIYRYPEVYLKYEKNRQDREVVDFVEAMKSSAVSKGVFLHLDKLFNRGDVRAREVERVFDEALTVATETGVELRLPLAVPKSVRTCEFVEEGGAFISWDGNVHPCYFLWHRYHCFIDGHEKFVAPKVFGSLKERGLLEIWNSPEYIAFRKNVLRYDYPYCFNCGFALCDYVQGEEFQQDCYVNTEPCGACLWCMGIFHCLR
jgi:putative metalloenzyme radical SAM/SPASM domain maturase